MSIDKRIAQLKERYDLNKLDDVRAFIREMDKLEQEHIREFEASLGIIYN